MTANVGTVDRIVRAVIGVVLLLAALGGGLDAVAYPYVKYAAIAVGVVMLVVATVRVCPIYMIFGLRTCPRS
mgnify:CR=1 FL=1